MQKQMLVREIVKIERESPDLNIRVKAAREAADMSILACAKAVKVSRQYWSQLENNRLESVSIDLIRTIETALGAKLL